MPVAGSSSAWPAFPARASRPSPAWSRPASTPCTGKSTPKPSPPAVDIPMDGFHLTRAQLVAMPDPATAIHRRGAAFTFDADGFYTLVQRLAATPIQLQPVPAPSFDHAVKDPVEKAISIPATARIVLVEGNYCALGRPPWSEAARLLTELWYLDIPSEVARERVAARHLLSGIVADKQAAWDRASGTDELNAQDIRENRLVCHEILVLA